MPPRITLGWSRCSICGRHAPTWRCRVGGRVVNLCMFCAYTLGARCEGLSVPVASPRKAVGAASLEPDEAVLERIGASSRRRGRRGARRRSAR